MLQYCWVVLLVICSNVQIDQFLYLHLFEDVFLIDTGEVIVVSIAAGLYLWHERIVETKGSILALGTSVVIHCVVSLKDRVLLASEILCFHHSSMPVFHLVELGDGSFFEIDELLCYPAMFVRHLYGGLHRVAFDCLGYLFEADCANISQV